jgi:ATP-dependent DNA ligase
MSRQPIEGSGTSAQFSSRCKGIETARGIWVEPSLLAEIEYRAKSADGKVRHPFFKGIREDFVMRGAKRRNGRERP